MQYILRLFLSLTYFSVSHPLMDDHEATADILYLAQESQVTVLSHKNKDSQV